MYTQPHIYRYICDMVALADIKTQIIINGQSFSFSVALQMLKSLPKLIYCKGCQIFFLPKQTILKLLLKNFNLHETSSLLLEQLRDVSTLTVKKYTAFL